MSEPTTTLQVSDLPILLTSAMTVVVSDDPPVHISAQEAPCP